MIKTLIGMVLGTLGVALCAYVMGAYAGGMWRVFLAGWRIAYGG